MERQTYMKTEGDSDGVTDKQQTEINKETFCQVIRGKIDIEQYKIDKEKKYTNKFE